MSGLISVAAEVNRSSRSGSLTKVFIMGKGRAVDYRYGIKYSALLLTFVFPMLTLAESSNKCASIFSAPTDPYLVALRTSDGGTVPAIHSKYGEGYLALNEKNNTMTFGQNSPNGRRIEDVPKTDVALELPARFELRSESQIQRDIPFLHKGQLSKTWGQFDDGSILAYSVSTGETFSVSVQLVKAGVLELAPKGISKGDYVEIDQSVERTARNARVISIKGIYAEVEYEFSLGTSAIPASASYLNAYPHAASKLIPLSQIKKVQ